MAIATCSSALNDRALCTSIALTMVRRAYVQALSQVTGPRRSSPPLRCVNYRRILSTHPGMVLVQLLRAQASYGGLAIGVSVCRTRPDSGSTDRSQLCHRGPGRSRDSSAPRARPPHQAALAPRAPAGSAVRDSAAPTPADEARPRATPRVGRSRTNGLPSRTNVCTRRKRTCGPQGGSPGLTQLGLDSLPYASARSISEKFSSANVSRFTSTPHVWSHHRQVEHFNVGEKKCVPSFLPPS